MKAARFDYRLPQEFIAQQPLPERDASRLLVLDRAARGWSDHRFVELPELLRPGDLLVLNDTRVIPARLRAIRGLTGGHVEVLLLPPEFPAEAPPRAGQTAHSPTAANRCLSLPSSSGEPPTVRRVLTRSGGRLRPGEVLTLAGGVKATLLKRLGEAGDVLDFSLSPEEFAAFVAAHGEVPLPPYIHRPPGPSAEADRDRYQTVYARANGAVAAPTAGLHFTPSVFAALERRGVERATLTLHVGPGTFKPVKTEEVAEHRVDPEPFEVGAAAAAAVMRAKAEGRRVIAAGTTVLRVLESRWDAAARTLQAGQGATDLFVYPPFNFQAADALLTNFHLPRSTLLMLVAAFASPAREDGIEWVLEAYRHAMQAGYRFYSYGDACLFV